MPLGAQMLTGPGRLFSRGSAHALWLLRAGPGPHTPPLRPCVMGIHRTPWGPACQTSLLTTPHPGLPEPSPAHLRLVCRCLSVYQGPATLLVPVDPAACLALRWFPPRGWVCRWAWGKGTSVTAERQAVDCFERQFHQELHVRCHVPPV